MADGIMVGIKDALAHAKRVGRGGGLVWTFPSGEEIKELRSALKLTQIEFAERFGFDLSAVRNWEQGRAKPERAKGLYLKMIKADPKGVMKLLDKVAEEDLKKKVRRELVSC